MTRVSLLNSYLRRNRSLRPVSALFCSLVLLLFIGLVSLPVFAAPSLPSFSHRTYTFTEFSTCPGDPILGNWVITNKQVITSDITCNMITITSKGSLVVDSATLGRMLRINANNLLIQGKGTITADGKGYTVGNGPGKGQAGNDYTGGGGGAYGGDAGDANFGGYGGTWGQSQGGYHYGNALTPFQLGSGGGNCGGGCAGYGSGGGALLINVSNTLYMDGTVRANGQNAGGSSYAGGGGSGGSIWVEATTLSGTGYFSAKGGNGANTGVDGGGGSGGRIAVYYVNTTSSFSFTKSIVQGGLGPDSAQDGDSGTLVFIDLDNNSLFIDEGFEFQASLNYDSITLNSALLRLNNSVSLTLNTLSSQGANRWTCYNTTSYLTLLGLDTLSMDRTSFGAFGLNGFQCDSLFLTKSSSKMTTLQNSSFLFVHSLRWLDPLGSLVLKNVTMHANMNGTLGNLTLDSLSRLDATGHGYLIATGPGKGATGTDYSGSGGGAYGGDAGDGNFGGYGGTWGQSAGGLHYGLVFEPSHFGSASGKCGLGVCEAAPSGSGGGAIKLTIADTLRLDGSVLAHGNSGLIHSSSYRYAGGGGAGGSIWITTRLLDGTGQVLALGGVGGNNSGVMGGGGSGGRIAVYYQDLGLFDFTQSSVQGGLGPDSAQDGDPGTLVFIDTDDRLLYSVEGFEIQQNLDYENITFHSALVRLNTTSQLNVTSFQTLGSNRFTCYNPQYNLSLFVLNEFSLNATRLHALGLNGQLCTSLFIVKPSLTSSVLEDSYLNVSNALIWDDLGYVIIKNTTLVANVQGNFSTLHIDNASKINADGRGYTVGNGPGKGASGTDYSGSGGGAFGGDAGDGNFGGYSGTWGQSAGGLHYGLVLEPSHFGSASGKCGLGLCDTAPSGSGGGRIDLHVVGTFTLDGVLSVNGNPGLIHNSASRYAGGGGSGGSIWITTRVLKGSGALFSNGGSGGNNSGVDAGGGSGGRIAVYYELLRGFNFTTSTVQGGLGPDSAQDGDLGTLVFIDTDDRLLYSAQGFEIQQNLDYENITFHDALIRVNKTANLTVQHLRSEGVNYWSCYQSNQNVTLETNASYDLSETVMRPSGLNGQLCSSVTVLKNANTSTLLENSVFNVSSVFIFHDNGSLVLDNTSFDANFNGTFANFTLRSNSLLNADFRGYPLGSGPGAGTAAREAQGAGGGGYGGKGGNGESGLLGGNAYGIAESPSLKGSGGGSCGYSSCMTNAGAGGGFILIRATERLLLDGSLRANGQDGKAIQYLYGGQAGAGGSGGSVFLTAPLLMGTGILLAEGGMGGNQSDADGGGGSGGRIAYCADPLYTGSPSVQGGLGPETAQEGSLGTVVSNVSALYIPPLNKVTSEYDAFGSIQHEIPSNTLFLSRNQDLSYTHPIYGMRLSIPVYFCSGLVNMSALRIDADEVKTYVQTKGTSASRSYTLLVPSLESSSLVVCPHATSLTTITPTCEGAVVFTAAEVALGTTKQGYFVYIENTSYAVQNITSGGIGVHELVLGNYTLNVQANDATASLLNVSVQFSSLSQITSAHALVGSELYELSYLHGNYYYNDSVRTPASPFTLVLTAENSEGQSVRYESDALLVGTTLTPSSLAPLSLLNVSGSVHRSDGTPLSNHALGFVFYSPYASFLALTPDGWFDGSWSYRIPLHIQESSGRNLSEYQLNVLLDTQTLISEGKMNPDCSDARFVDDSLLVYSYWLENQSLCNTPATSYWIKIPTLPSFDTRTVYFYYGNSAALSLSNPHDTFLLYDDFEAYTTVSDLTPAGWIDISIHAADLQLNRTGGAGASQALQLYESDGVGWDKAEVYYADRQFSKGVILEWDWYEGDDDHYTGVNGFNDDIAVSSGCDSDQGSNLVAVDGNCDSTGNDVFRTESSNSGNEVDIDFMRTGWKHAQIIWDDTSSFTLEGTLKGSRNANIPSGPLYLHFSCFPEMTPDGSPYCRYDNVIVRTYAPLLPILTYGSEEFMYSTDAFGKYEYLLQVPAYVGEYTFHVNTTEQGLHGENVQRITLAGDDVTSPRYVMNAAPTQGTSGESVVINVTGFDNEGIASAVLLVNHNSYLLNSSLEFPHEFFYNLTLSSTNTSSLYYNVTFTDPSGNTNTTPTTTLRVLDNDLPTVSSLTPTLGNITFPFNMTLSYQDLVGVARCDLYVNDTLNGTMDLFDTSKQAFALPSQAGIANRTVTFTTPGIYPLHTQCYDVDGNTNIQSVTNVTLVDEIAPQYVMLSAPTNGTTGEEMVVTIKLTDPSGIFNVMLNIDGTNYPMNYQKRVYTYTYSIPSLSLNPLTYWVAFSDPYGNVDLTSVYTLVVSDNDPPTVLNITPTQAMINEPVTLRAVVGDNIALESCILFSEEGQIGEMDILDHVAQYETAFTTVRNYTLFANCTDSTGNVNATSLTTFTVYEDPLQVELLSFLTRSTGPHPVGKEVFARANIQSLPVVDSATLSLGSSVYDLSEQTPGLYTNTSVLISSLSFLSEFYAHNAENREQTLQVPLVFVMNNQSQPFVRAAPNESMLLSGRVLLSNESAVSSAVILMYVDSDLQLPMEWWNTAWTYRMPISLLEQSASSLTNYQLELSLDTQALISEGKMNPDCSDVRFIDNTQTELKYWIVNQSLCNTPATPYWVKVPTLLASQETTLMLYYGNEEASSLSDPYTTFLLYDDFERYTTVSDLALAGWIDGSINAADLQLNLTDGMDDSHALQLYESDGVGWDKAEVYYATRQFSKGVILEWDWYEGDDDHYTGVNGFNDDITVSGGCDGDQGRNLVAVDGNCDSTGNDVFRTESLDVGGEVDSDFERSGWKHAQIIWDDTSSFTLEGTLKGSRNANIPSGPLYLHFSCFPDGYPLEPYCRYDNVVIRTYARVVPTYTLESEQSLPMTDENGYYVYNLTAPAREGNFSLIINTTVPGSTPLLLGEMQERMIVASEDVLTPWYVIHAAPLVGTTGESFLVNLTAYDDVSVSNVTITFENQTSVMNGTSGAYLYWIHVPLNQTSSFNYSMTVSDMSGNTNTTAAFAFVSVDNDAPLISTLSPTYVYLTEPVTISALVTDNLANLSCIIYQNDTSQGSMNLSFISNASAYSAYASFNASNLSTYSFFLASWTQYYHHTGYVALYANCTDFAGNWNVSYLPYLYLLDNHPPWYVINSIPSVGTTGDAVFFNISGYDDDGILLAAYDFNGTYYYPSPEGNDYILSLNISETNLTPLTYQFGLVDYSWHLNMTPLFNITILDNDPPAVSNLSLSSALLGISTPVNVSFSDNIAVDRCVASIDLGANESMFVLNTSAEVNLTFTQEGVHTLSVTCFDLQGNFNSSSTSVTVSIPPDTKPPWYVLHSYPANGTTGEVALLNLSAYDNIELSSVVLFTESLNTTLSSVEDTYTYSFAVPLDSLIPFTYAVLLTDTSNNSNRTPLQTFTPVDNDAPTVSQVSPLYGEISEPLLLNVQVTDNIEVASCELFVNGTSYGRMELLGSNASLEVVFDSSGSYLVFARCNDTSSQSATGSFASVVIGDSTLPTYVVNNAPLFGTTGETVFVNITPFDTVGILAVNITVDGNTFAMQPSGLDYVYRIAVPLDSLDQISYAMHVYDLSLNLNSTSSYALSVSDNDAPSYAVVSAPITAELGSSVLVNITGFDNIEVTSVLLQTSQGTYSMAKRATSYVYSLSVPSTPQTLTYNVTLSDAAGNTNTTATYVLTPTDTEAPLVSSLSPLTGTVLTPFTLLVNVSDNVAVTTCILYLENVSQGMMNVTANVASYTAVFSNPGSYLAYANCSDAADNWGVGSAVLVSFVYVDATPPWYVMNSAPTLATTGESVVINISGYDDLGISDATLFVQGIPFDMQRAGNEFIYTLSIPESSISPLSYHIMLSDLSNFTNITPEFVLTVSDNDAPLISEISPSFATENVPLVLTATVSDNIAVTACSLYIDTVRVDALTIESGTASITHVFSESGVYSVYANCSDAAGNVAFGSSGSIAVSYLDTIAPWYVINSAPNEGTTGDAVFVNVTGYDDVSVANATLAVRGVSELMDRNGNDFTFSFTVPESNLSDITYAITLVDSSGFTNTTPVVTVQVSDNDAPLLGTLNSQTVTVSEVFDVNITISDNIGVAACALLLTGLSQEPMSLGVSTASVQFSLESAGTYNASVRCIDAAGNFNETDAVVFTVLSAPDTRSPWYVINSAPILGTTGESVLVNITGLDDSSVTHAVLTLDGMNQTMDQDGTFFTSELAIPSERLDSVHYFVTLFDSSENSNTTPLFDLIVTDNDAPFVLAITPTSGNEDEQMILSSEVTDNIGVVSCVLYLDALSLGAMNLTSGTASIVYVFSEPGVYTAYANCSDAAGNIGIGPESPLIISLVDTQAPWYRINSAPNVSTTGESLFINITGYDDLAVAYADLFVSETFLLRMNRSTDDFTAALSVGSSSLQSFNYSVLLTDAAGNVNVTPSIPVSILDNDAPSVSELAPIFGQVNSSLLFIATVTDNIAVTACTLYVNGSLEGSMNITENTTSVRHLFDHDGQYVVYANCSDAAGNQAYSPTILSIAPPVLDTSPPRVTILLPQNNSQFTDQTPLLRVQFTDDLGLDPESVSFTLDSERHVLSLLDCSQAQRGALEMVCVFTSPRLALGRHQFFARVADTSTNWNEEQIAFTLTSDSTGSSSDGGSSDDNQPSDEGPVDSSVESPPESAPLDSDPSSNLDSHGDSSADEQGDFGNNNAHGDGESYEPQDAKVYSVVMSEVLLGSTPVFLLNSQVHAVILHPYSQAPLYVILENNGTAPLTNIHITLTDLPSSVVVEPRAVSVTSILPGEKKQVLLGLTTEDLREPFTSTLSLSARELHTQMKLNMGLQLPHVASSYTTSKVIRKLSAVVIPQYWFLLLILLPLLTFFAVGVTPYADDSSVRLLLMQNRIPRYYRRLYVNPEMYAQYLSLDQKGLRPLELTSEQEHDAALLMKKHRISFSLASLIAAAKHSFIPVVYHQGTVPESLKRSLRMVFFVDLLEEQHKEQLSTYIDAQRSKGFSDAQIRSVLLKSGWKEELVYSLLDPVVDVRVYIQHHLETGTSVADIKSALVRAGWSHKIVQKELLIGVTRYTVMHPMHSVKRLK